MTGGEIFLLVLFAFGGHRYSARTGMTRGTTPWHLPSVIWGLICLGLGPFGLLLEFVAVRTTKPVSMPVPVGHGAPGGGSAPPSPWSAGAQPALEETATAMPFGIAAADDGSGKSALFGWYPDPTGRHERRYWDGKGWTALVEDQRVTANDPL